MTTRTMISTVEVDPTTGAGIPGTGGAWEIQTQDCPKTCTGTVSRIVGIDGSIRLTRCTSGWCW